jgi:hypothetical protein
VNNREGSTDEALRNRCAELKQQITQLQIEQEKLFMVFGPFFSTKVGSEAAGFGLTPAKKIFDVHHSNINVCNRPVGDVK